MRTWYYEFESLLLHQVRRASRDIVPAFLPRVPDALGRTRAHTDGQGRKNTAISRVVAGQPRTTATARVWRATSDDDEQYIYAIAL